MVAKYKKRHSTFDGKDGQYVDRELDKISTSISTSVDQINSTVSDVSTLSASLTALSASVTALTGTVTALSATVSPLIPTTGSFTPGVTYGGGNTGVTYTSRSGVYVQQGKLIHVQGKIVLLSQGSSTGVVVITGLPFAAHATIDGLITASVVDPVGVGSESFYSFITILHNTTTMSLNYSATDATLGTWSNTDFVSGYSLTFAGSYLAA